jgi:hypothetical protein
MNCIKRDISNLSLQAQKFKVPIDPSPIKKFLEETSKFTVQEARYSFKKMFLETRNRRKKMRLRIS